MSSFSDASGTTVNSGSNLEQQLLSVGGDCHPQQQQQLHDRNGFLRAGGYHQAVGSDQALQPPAPPPPPRDLHPSASSGPRSTDSSAPDSPAGPADDMQMAIGGGGGGQDATMHGGYDQVADGYHQPAVQLPTSLQLYSQLYHASRHHHHPHDHHQPHYGHQTGGGADGLHSTGAVQRPATQQAVAAADHSAVWRPY